MVPAGLFSNIMKGVGRSGVDATHGAVGRALGGAGRTMGYGAAAGGLYGAAADDTSMIGGAMMGAGLGLGGRYARAGGMGVRSLMKSNSRVGAPRAPAAQLGQAFGNAVRNRATVDYHGAVMRSNSAANRIGSSLKGWTHDMRAGLGNAYGHMF